MTNYLRKSKSLFSTTLSSSISTGTGETITLASVTGLPTDTEITITIDRVDSSGSSTPTKMERITGTLSGSNLINYTRGADGSTEQAHAGGAVIEIIWNASDWNDFITGFLVGHKQTGEHAGSSIVASNIAASAITAGTLAASAVVSGDIAASAVVAGNLAASSVVSGNLAFSTATLTGSETFTNKRITKRVGTTTSSATPTINTDLYDVYTITAQSAAITSFTTNLSGTPTDGQTLIISITDDGTARAITWGASFASSGNVTLPTTTVVSTRLDVGFIWNTATSKWRCIGVA